MEWLPTLPLELFPPGSLTSSVITTVWVGVFVVALFNLRFGWVLSGLVVPGYLVPLLIIKPWSVVAIVVEGVVAYLLVWLFSERLSRGGWWSALFGRDRFFALILASVGVRLFFDGWLLPQVGAFLDQNGLHFDYRNELHSFGLVVVSLVANQFWKSGVVRGVPVLLVTVGISWLIVRYGLMEFTNFSLSNIGYMYEDLAASILASPKAYIILITTAFVASRMNLHYGWDFNGILLPALLALQWYEPLKIVTSFGEAFIILALASLLLRLPPFSRMTIEGAHKLLLFFNIGFLYKIALGFALIEWSPTTRGSDLFAFGYLLSTLLAIRMHEKGIVVRLTRATLQTSFLSMVAASGVGLLLTLIPLSLQWHSAADGQIEQVQRIDRPPFDTLLDRLPELYHGRVNERITPLPQEIDRFSQALRTLLDWRSQDGEEALLEAATLLASIGYRLELLEGGQLLLSEEGKEGRPIRGWGIYLINSHRRDGVVVEVPKPLEARGLLEGATALYLSLSARALALAGASGAGRDAQSLFHAFHRQVDRTNVLQLHTSDTTTTRDGGGNSVQLPPTNQLWVKRRLPSDLDLKQLTQLVGPFSVEWGVLPDTDLERAVSVEGFAELMLNRVSLRRLLFAPIVATEPLPLQLEQRSIEGYLVEWLAEGKGRIAPSGSDLYQIPTIARLLYFDEQLLTPLQQVLDSGYRGGEWSDESLAELRALNRAAGVVGYQLIRYRQSGTGEEYLILTEREGEQRYWGTYIFRPDEVAHSYAIQVPRPLYEVNSFEFAVALFERLGARLLSIGGSHPAANRDHSADLVRGDNQLSLFTLVSQVVQRESGSRPLLTLQVRALQPRPGENQRERDILLAFANGATSDRQLTAEGQQLRQLLESDGWDSRLVSGAADEAGYEVGGLPQSRYLAASLNDDFALVWVPPATRSLFRSSDDQPLLSARFESLSIARSDKSLFEYLQNRESGEENRPLPLASDSRLMALLEEYLTSHDILKLAAARDAAREKSLHLRLLVEQDSGQQLLLIEPRSGPPVAIVNLNPRDPTERLTISADLFKRGTITRFLERRSGWLLIE